MDHNSINLYFKIVLLAVYLSVVILASEEVKKPGVYLNENLCRYVGSGSTDIFYKNDVDYCRCYLDKEEFHCTAMREVLSRSNEQLGNFQVNLSTGPIKFNRFINLFTSRDVCDIDENGKRVVIGVTDEIKSSIQLGIITTLALDLDEAIPSPSGDSAFTNNFITNFPAKGTASTPHHCQNDFSLRVDAPLIFKILRNIYGEDEREFMLSIGNYENELKNLGKLGGSGNGFYLTHDNKYFIKTTSDEEYENFMKMLPSYFRHMEDHHLSLLSKLSGLYQYRPARAYDVDSSYFITNNLIPSGLNNIEKFDLKGSTVNRKTSDNDLRTKKSPTLKDLDFLDMYPEGFFIDPEIYNRFVQALKFDIEFLLSQNCLDYSLLLVVSETSEGAIESDNLYAIPAKTKEGKQKMLHLGIIDILQPYSGIKKIQSSLMSIMRDKSSISVIEPSAYAERFEKFVLEKVLHPSS